MGIRRMGMDATANARWKVDILAQWVWGKSQLVKSLLSFKVRRVKND